MTLPESRLGAWWHLPDFLIVPLIDKYRKSGDLVILDLGRRSSSED
jgi:hypothetical protein